MPVTDGSTGRIFIALTVAGRTAPGAGGAKGDLCAGGGEREALKFCGCE